MTTRIKRWCGGVLQRWAWWLCNPHDSWAVEWRDESGKYCANVSTGHYLAVRALLRDRRNGRILGNGAQIIPADGGGTP